MPHDPDDPKVWLEYANEDQRSVRVLLTASPPLADPAAFHVQQAVEKGLKAILVSRRQPVPRTHNIRELLDAIEFDETLARLRPILIGLTVYAVRFRYPDTGFATRVELESAVAAMDELLEWVAKKLQKHCP